MHEELASPRHIAEMLHADAIQSLSVTRNNEAEITSVRQLRTLEEAARQILSMRLDDPAINDAAAAMLEQAAWARRWRWVNVPAAAAMAIVAALLGIGAAALGGTGDNIVLAVLGGVLGSALLCVAVLRYRRENWRIRAEEIAPMIFRPGV
jgi:hypothetical protein